MRIHRKKASQTAPLVVALGFLFAATTAAQWLELPLPRTPRTPDGKPNLSAPVPRAAGGTPDLSGIWLVDTNRYNANLVADGNEAPMLPWAAELYKQRLAT